MSNNILVFLLICALTVESTMGRLRGNGAREQVDNWAQDVLDSLNVLDRVSSSHTQRRQLQEQQVETPFMFHYNPTDPGPSCQGNQADELSQQYQDKLATWNESPPSCYQFTYEPSCFRCAEPVRVTVVNGIVTAPINHGSDDRNLPTMEDMFDRVRSCAYDCSQGYIHQCKVQFETTESGLPFVAGLLTDEEEELVDDELAYYVRDFSVCSAAEEERAIQREAE